MTNRGQILMANSLSKAYDVLINNFSKHIPIILFLLVVKIIIKLLVMMWMKNPQVYYILKLYNLLKVYNLLNGWLIAGIVALIYAVIFAFLIAYSIIQIRGVEMSTTEIIKFVFNPKLLINYLVAYFILLFVISIGMVSVVPGIVLAAGLIFTLYLVLDKKLNPFKAMIGSWTMTKGYKMELFLLFLAVVVVYLALDITVVLAPLAYLYGTLAVAAAYETLSFKNTNMHEKNKEQEDLRFYN